MLAHVIDGVRAAGCNRVVVVVGAGRHQVIAQFAESGVEFAEQVEQRGTGDAVLACRQLMTSDEECVVVPGDVPLMRGSTIRRMIAARRTLAADISVLTAVLDRPDGYGRIVRTPDGWISAIVEERDADDNMRRVREVNSGFYSFRWHHLLPALQRIAPSPVTHEYYLTDAVTEVHQSGGRIAGVCLSDAQEMAGVNTPEQLAIVAARANVQAHSFEQ